MAAAAAPPLALSEELRVDLERCSRSATLPHRLVVRATIVLACADGESTYAIAKRFKCSESAVRKWRGRIAACPRLSSLDDLPRSGRPAEVPTGVRCDVARLACSRPKDNHVPFGELWTLTSLRDAVAEETGWLLSKSEIHKILECNGLKPHRVHSWLHSTDPQFREKVNAITDLYAEPPPGATVLSFDEKTGMQATERKHSSRPAVPGRPVREEFEYTRHGTATLLAAFDIRTGEVTGQCARRTGENLVRFFDALAAKYPSGDVYVILDNLNVHHGARWDSFNERHGGRFHFVYTPLHGSWINQIELWFSILQRRTLRHASFLSNDELVRTVLGFIAYWNRVEAHPFRWRFRGYERTSPLAMAA